MSDKHPDISKEMRNNSQSYRHLKEIEQLFDLLVINTEKWVLHNEFIYICLELGQWLKFDVSQEEKWRKVGCPGHHSYEIFEEATLDVKQG